MSKEVTPFEGVSLETLEKELVDARQRVEFLEQKIYDTKKANKEIAWNKLIDAIREYEDQYGPVQILDVSGDYWNLGNYATYDKVGEIEIFEEEQ